MSSRTAPQKDWRAEYYARGPTPYDHFNGDGWHWQGMGARVTLDEGLYQMHHSWKKTWPGASWRLRNQNTDEIIMGDLL